MLSDNNDISQKKRFFFFWENNITHFTIHIVFRHHQHKTLVLTWNSTYVAQCNYFYFTNKNIPIIIIPSQLIILFPSSISRYMGVIFITHFLNIHRLNNTIIQHFYIQLLSYAFYQKEWWPVKKKKKKKKDWIVYLAWSKPSMHLFIKILKFKLLFLFPLRDSYGQATAISSPKASFQRRQLNQILITAEEELLKHSQTSFWMVPSHQLPWIWGNLGGSQLIRFAHKFASVRK